MKLTDLLIEKRPAIIKRWLEVIFESYPADTSIFLKTKKDQFANPVGYTLTQGIEAIFDELLGKIDAESSAQFLDGIVRIRAVQEGPPSRALVFMPLLKDILRELLGQSLQDNAIALEMLELESKIDAITLRAFDNFMKCREKIYELKANETKNLTYRLLQKAQMLCEKRPEEGEDLENNSDKSKSKEVAK